MHNIDRGFRFCHVFGKGVKEKAKRNTVRERQGKEDVLTTESRTKIEKGR